MRFTSVPRTQKTDMSFFRFPGEVEWIAPPMRWRGYSGSRVDGRRLRGTREPPPYMLQVGAWSEGSSCSLKDGRTRVGHIQGRAATHGSAGQSRGRERAGGITSQLRGSCGRQRLPAARMPSGSHPLPCPPHPNQQGAGAASSGRCQGLGEGLARLLPPPFLLLLGWC